MCNCHEQQDTGEATPLYQEFPPLIVGGPTGDYFVPCPIPSGRWAEFAVDCITNGDGGPGAVVVSGRRAPKALLYDGSVTLSNDTSQAGSAYRIPATTTLPVNGAWERITSSDKKVYVRIDAAANTSMQVTLRFRSRILERIPGPFTTVHPDHMHQMNLERERTTRERLADMGVPEYTSEYNKGAKD